MTNYRYWLQITSSSWSFVSAILGIIVTDVLVVIAIVKFVFYLLDLSLGTVLICQDPFELSPAQLLRENTDSVLSNKRMSPTTPSVPLK
nr:hypothetical protein [Tanacetum cinerariifolium]